MTAQQQHERLMYTPEQLATALQCSVSTVRNRCERNEIAATKHGRFWRIPRREYLRLVGDEAGIEVQGDSETRRRERALRDIRAMALEVIERCDRALGE